MKRLYTLFVCLLSIITCQAEEGCQASHSGGQIYIAPIHLVDHPTIPIIITPTVPSYIQTFRHHHHASYDQPKLAPGRHYVDVSYLMHDHIAWERRLKEYEISDSCPYGYDHTPFASAPCPCIEERARRIAEEQKQLELQRAQEQARIKKQQEQMRAEQARQRELQAQAQKEAEQKRQQEQERLQAEYNERCDCSIEQLAELADSFEQEINYSNDVPIKERYKKRIYAIRSLVSDKRIYTETKLVNAALESHFKSHDIDAQPWKTCTGNALQQELHNEFLEFCIRLFDDQVPMHVEFFYLRIADIGRAYNHMHKVITSMTLADWCWALGDLAIGIGHGLWQGTKNTAHAVCHPIDTMANIIIGIGTVSYYTAYYTAELCVIKLLRSIHHPEGERLWRHFLDECDQVINAIGDACAQMKVRDAACHGTALVTETYLQGKLLHNIGGMFEQAKQSALLIARDLESSLPALERLAQTPEGLQVAMAEETLSYMAQESDKIRKGGRAGQKTRNYIRRIKLTNKQIREIAAENKWIDTGRLDRYKHQIIFQDPKYGNYYSYDIDGHNGGIWKLLNKNDVRMATCDRSGKPFKN